MDTIKREIFVVVGVSGSGKTTLTKGLEGTEGYSVLHMDKIDGESKQETERINYICSFLENFLQEEFNISMNFEETEFKEEYLRKLKEEPDLIKILYELVHESLKNYLEEHPEIKTSDSKIETFMRDYEEYKKNPSSFNKIDKEYFDPLRKKIYIPSLWQYILNRILPSMKSLPPMKFKKIIIDTGGRFFWGIPSEDLSKGNDLRIVYIKQSPDRLVNNLCTPNYGKIPALIRGFRKNLVAYFGSNPKVLKKIGEIERTDEAKELDRNGKILRALQTLVSEDDKFKEQFTDQVKEIITEYQKELDDWISEQSKSCKIEIIESDDLNRMKILLSNIITGSDIFEDPTKPQVQSEGCCCVRQTDADIESQPPSERRHFVIENDTDPKLPSTSKKILL